MSFENTQALEQTLKETPAVRPEVVERAAGLVADPNYPSNDVLDGVADTLARNILS